MKDASFVDKSQELPLCYHDIDYCDCLLVVKRKDELNLIFIWYDMECDCDGFPELVIERMSYNYN